MEKYIELVLEVIEFDAEDVLTTSPSGNEIETRELLIRLP